MTSSSESASGGLRESASGELDASALNGLRELARAGRYLEAVAGAESLTATQPTHREALYLLAACQRCLDRIPDALLTLERLEQHHPGLGRLYQERGHCYVKLRDARRAIVAFRRAVEINPALQASWTLLARLYRTVGDAKNAAIAAEQIEILQRLPAELVHAGSLFSDGELTQAETIVRAYLLRAGDHAEGLRLLARIEQKRAALDRAEQHLEAALRLSPTYRAARVDYVRVLIERQKYLRAHEESSALLQVDPANREYLSLLASACFGLGDHERAIDLYGRLLTAEPGAAELRVALAHVLKTIGRQDQAIESYRAAAESRPDLGDAYWSLANLKTYRFSEAEIARMRAAEEAPATRPVDRYHLSFALGKAFEDRGEYALSWHYYERGNALKRIEIQYRPEAVEADTREQKATCTAGFLAARAGSGAPDTDPIFIVGLPRSGSTLVEQILASHSMVESTHELSDIHRIVTELEGYPGVLADLTVADFRALGQRYIAETRHYRITNRPLFIDKMPNNFRHIGLIHLMLPNARIIDVRREPMACCFSNLKQLFAGGQGFTYGMEDIARYYRTYLDLMRHWHEVLPGKVLRVQYEELVDDLEGNVRRILQFCGLHMEPSCIEFYKTRRGIRTPSSEQVRQPLFREGLHQWRHYEAWLGPLEDALGDALTRYLE